MLLTPDSAPRLCLLRLPSGSLVRPGSAGIEPPIVFLTASPNGPADLLDEPMELSLADKARLGIQMEHDQNYNSEHLQFELRMALERIRSDAGYSVPLGGAAPAENKPFDGMDPVSSAMLMELAATVMPQKTPQVAANDIRYTPAQRQFAIKRWMAKRARRHLTSQTKYVKMKAVAVNKSRCKGGKFIKKSERERMEREARDREEAMLAVATVTPVLEAPVAAVASIAAVGKAKEPWVTDPWQQAYNFYARPEE